MKKHILAIILAIVMVVGATPITSAAGSGAQGMVDAANSYLENAVGPDFGGGESDWCGRFLYRCAENAGETAALCGSVDTMKSTNGAMKWFVQNGCEGGYFYQGINCGNYGMTTDHLKSKDAYSPALGDIIFYDWDGNPTNFGHMELVTGISGRTITTIGGSTGESCSNDWPITGYNNGKPIKRHHVHAHTYDINHKFIVGYARPNYGGSTAGTTPVVTEPTGSTKTQYRYHRYVTSDGRASLCPYYGASTYGGAKLTLQYTDWMDQPLTCNSNPGGHNHVNQGAACTNSGCIDPSGKTERFTDGSSNWYYEETRTVTVEQPSGAPTTPAPAPAPAPATPVPTAPPTAAPTAQPTSAPTAQPTSAPTAQPTSAPTAQPTSAPTARPTATPAPRPTPTPEPAGFESRLEEVFKPARDWSALTFDDISSTAWYYDNVKAAYRYELMNGRGQNQFQPEGTLTVAEAVTLATRIHAAYYGNTIPTYDGGNWYDGAVAYAARNGIPADAPYEIPATREVFARILAAALPEEELRDSGNAINFADASALRYPAAIELLCQAGVINGISRNGSYFFEPASTITRAQAAAIVTRMVIPGARLGNG